MSRPSSRMRAWSTSSSIKTSPTPRSTSVCDTRHFHGVVRDDSGDGDDLVPTDDEGPSFAVGARDLGVDEHVLDLSGTPGEAVTGSPASYLKPWQVGPDAPRPPFDLAAQVDRRALEPEPLVLAHGLGA